MNEGDSRQTRPRLPSHPDSPAILTNLISPSPQASDRAHARAVWLWGQASRPNMMLSVTAVQLLPLTTSLGCHRPNDSSVKVHAGERRSHMAESESGQCAKSNRGTARTTGKGADAWAGGFISLFRCGSCILPAMHWQLLDLTGKRA
jgi:hypothetical protein